MQCSLNRRNFLRGAAATVAIPSLASLLPASVTAANLSSATRAVGTTASNAPLRAAFVYFPNGAIPKSWWPDADADGKLKLSETLSPLADVQQSLQVLKGLDLEPAEGKKDGAGDHARGNSTFMTGVRLNKSATKVRAGVSFDQVLAQEIGDQTRFRSLELTCDVIRNSGDCDSGYSCAYQYNMSWRSATMPMVPESNPRLVFERLFGSGNPQQRRRNLQQRLQQQKSVLDFVLADAKRIHSRLQRSDRRKLDEYLTAVRSIESRIQRAERFEAPHVDAATPPSGIPNSYREHIGLMFDLLKLAFQTDSTRVATFSLAHDGSNRSFQEINVVEGHHELSHHRNQPDKIEKVARIDKFYVQQFAKFLSELKTLNDSDGNSILHNSMIVYGSGNADGNHHTHRDLPILLAGHGGGSCQTERLVDHQGQPLSNLFLSLADHMGAGKIKSFGDATGRLKNSI